MLAALAGSLRRAEALARPCAQWVREMATKKSGGSGGRVLNRNPKMLGMKVRGDALVKAGGIIMRQRGAKYVPGENAAMGRDHTIYALVPGYVEFKYVNSPKAYYYTKSATKGKFSGSRHFINVWPESWEEYTKRIERRKELYDARRAHMPFQFPKVRKGPAGENIGKAGFPNKHPYGVQPGSW